MRSSTIIVGILFLLAVVMLTVNLFVTPLVEGIIVRYAEESVPHAIIPDEVREKWDREGWPKEVKPRRSTTP